MSRKITISVVALVLLSISPVFAQSGAINGTSALLTPSGRPIRMTEASLTFQAPPRQHVFQVDDIIYVHVRDRLSYTNTANNQRRKRVENEFSITAWTKFAGLFKMPFVTREALPEIGTNIDHRTQNQGRLNREETIDFVIPSRVTDVRDNGNLVIEGNRDFGIGEEGSIITVTGIVRPDAIGRDNRVESNQVADLVIRNIPSGNVYDTVRRPWGARLIEQFKPF